jgi:hypothetical protein
MGESRTARAETLAGGWFGADLLAELRAVNLKLIEWLHARVVLSAESASRSAMLHENRALWLGLDAGSMRRLAECPCALVDAGFAQQASWQAIATAAVRDVAPRAYGDPNAILLNDPAGLQVARLTMALAWHLARHRPTAATISLGLSDGTAAVLQSLRLTTIDRLPEALPMLVQPRWRDEPRVWAQMLQAAIGGAPLQLESARVSMLQLIARQLGEARAREAARIPPADRAT